MTKVLVWPAHPTDACSWYRLRFPAAAVAASSDIEVEVTSKGPTVYWDRAWDGDIPPLDAKVLGLEKPDADVVVIQRPGRWVWSVIVVLLQAHGIRVVVDVDDNFDAIDPTHVSYRHYHPGWNRAHNRDWIREACEHADLVTVTTPALLDHYGFGHGRVLPNLVPESYLKVAPDEQLMAVGWSGHVGTHPQDLQVTGGGIQLALEHCPGWMFHTIGTGEGVAGALGLKQPPSTTGRSWVPFEQYPHRLAELAVGIVPLEDSPFNHAKSGLKLLELSAVGVPAVASPTPDNRRLHRMGLGELAATPREWFSKVRALMRDNGYCTALAGRSREAARSLTYEDNAEMWVRAWSGRPQQ